MSDQEDAPAARGVLGGRVCRTFDRNDAAAIAHVANPNFRLMTPHLNTVVSSRMKTFPAISTSSFLILGIQFRWVLTRCPLAHALVSQAELAIDDSKE